MARRQLTAKQRLYFGTKAERLRRPLRQAGTARKRSQRNPKKTRYVSLWDRAQRLYERYKTESREYQDIARELGYSPQELNARINRIRSERKYGQTQRNPRSSIECIGRAVEIRYRRDVGQKRGYYKHEVTSNAGVYTLPAGWFYVSKKSVLITGKAPRV